MKIAMSDGEVRKKAMRDLASSLSAANDEGIKSGKLTTAVKLKALGVDASTILAATGLNPDEI